MAVGDSITHGVRGQQSYRKPMNDLLAQATCDFQFVGSQINTSPPSDFVSPHEGYTVHRADDFLTGRSDEAGDNRGIASAMALSNPDVVILHIGTNDARLGQNNSETVAEIDQIVATILKHLSLIHI